MWYPATEQSVLVRMAEEVHDLRQLRLRLVDSRDVGKRDAVTGRLVPARARTAERAENSLNAPGASHHPEQQQEKEERRPEAE